MLCGAWENTTAEMAKNRKVMSCFIEQIYENVFIFFGEKIVDQSISYNPFGLLRKNIPYYLKGPDASGGGVARLSRDGPRRASQSGQDGHINVFICTL